MSLINQVLHDLDRRQAGAADANQEVVDGLAYTTLKVKRHRSYTRYAWYSLAVILLFVLAYFTAQFYNNNYSADKPLHVVQTNHLVPVEVIQPKEVTIIKVEGMSQAESDTAHGVATVETPVVETRPAETAINSTSVTSVNNVEPVTQTEVSSVSKQEVAPTNVSKTSRPHSPQQQAELAYQNAYHYLSQGQNLKAEQELKSGLSYFPAHVKCRELLAGMLIQQGRWVEASELLRQGIEINDGYPVFVTLYARSLMQLGNNQQAINVLIHYAPNLHDNPDHYALLAAIYQRVDDHASAIRVYSEVLKVRPEVGIWWVGLGISLEAIGETDQAMLAYKRARQSGTLNADTIRYTDNRLQALDDLDYPVD